MESGVTPYVTTLSNICKFLLLFSMLFLLLSSCEIMDNHESESRDFTRANMERSAEKMKLLYDPALEEYFGLQPDEYIYYGYYLLTDTLDVVFVRGLLDIVDIQVGDTLPSYYWNKSEELLYCIIRRDNGSFSLYTVKKNDAIDPETVDAWDFKNLWTVLKIESFPSTTIEE